MKSEKCGVLSSSSGFSEFRLLGFLFLAQNSDPTGSNRVVRAKLDPVLLWKVPAGPEGSWPNGPVCSAGSRSDPTGLRYLFRKKLDLKKMSPFFFFFQHFTSIMTF